MKKIFLATSVVFFAICMMGMNSKVTYYGKWKISRAVAYARVSAMSPEEVKSYIGKRLEYTAQRARFEDEIYENPVYKQTIYREEEFSNDFDVAIKTLGINSESIVLVEIEDWVEFGSLLIIKNNDVMITHWDGVYFELVRDK